MLGMEIRNLFFKDFMSAPGRYTFGLLLIPNMGGIVLKIKDNNGALKFAAG